MRVRRNGTRDECHTTRLAPMTACGVRLSGQNDRMQTVRASAGLLIVLALLAATPAAADPVGVVKESGRTAGHAVRDGAQTVGRTVGDFFKHGPHTAKRTWQENAARTKADAHADKEHVKQEAHSEK
jgi:hypothetical protein